MSGIDEIHNMKTNLLKREETERAIEAEHSRLKDKLNKLRMSFCEGFQKAEICKEEGIIFSHRSASVSAESNQLKVKIEGFRKEILDLEKEIDNITAKNKQVEIVKEKEEKSRELYRIEMKEKQTLINEFWSKVLKGGGVTEKKGLREKLVEEKDMVKQKIDDNNKELQMNIDKLTQETSILKKRNAAHIKRMSRKIIELEEKIQERQEYLTQLRRSK